MTQFDTLARGSQLSLYEQKYTAEDQLTFSFVLEFFARLQSRK